MTHTPPRRKPRGQKKAAEKLVRAVNVIVTAARDAERALTDLRRSSADARQEASR